MSETLAAHRIIEVVHYEPWLLGWCRWEITTTLRSDNPEGTPARCVLAAGRWKWRGRHASFMHATVDAEPWFYGPPLDVVA